MPTNDPLPLNNELSPTLATADTNAPTDEVSPAASTNDGPVDAPTPDAAPEANDDSEPNAQGSTPAPRQTITDDPVANIIALALEAGATYFHSSDDHAYVSIPMGNRRTAVPIDSQKLRNWLQQLYFTRHRTVIQSRHVKSAIRQMEAIAKFEGPEELAPVRRACVGNGVVIDLGRTDGATVVVSGGSCTVTYDTQHHFQMPVGMLPMAMPETGGSVRDLQTLIGLAADNQKRHSTTNKTSL